MVNVDKKLSSEEIWRTPETTNASLTWKVTLRKMADSPASLRKTLSDGLEAQGARLLSMHAGAVLDAGNLRIGNCVGADVEDEVSICEEDGE